MQNHMLFLGLGYSAAYVATQQQARGWKISGTARSSAGADRIAARGWRGIVFDGESPSSDLVAALNEATHVLVSIPPELRGDPALHLHRSAFAKAPLLRWIGYFSTVGVYGDAGSDWVDETTPCTPASERGKRRLQAERDWQALGAARKTPVTVLRLPGIYGPGRSAIDAIRSGTARRIIKPGQVFNRIHVEDIAAAVLAALDRPERDGVYNVTDDEPSPPQDVVAFAAALLGVPPPPEVPFEMADLSPMARSFYGESKRVSNARLKRELGFVLKHPTYREGLAAIAASGV